MNEHEFGRAFREWADGEASESPSTGFRQRALDAPEEASPVATSSRLSFRPRTMVPALGGLAAAVLLVVVAGSLLSPPTQEGKEPGMKVGSSIAAAATAAALATSSAAGAVDLGPPPDSEWGEFNGHISHWAGAGRDEDSGATLYRYKINEISEPRFDGDISLAVRSEFLDDYGRTLWLGAFRIETEEGAWQEPPHLTLEYRDGSASTHTSAFVGEGAYEGLTALVEMTYLPVGDFALRGVITEDTVPPTPVWADD